MWTYYVLALCLYCFYSLFSFLVMFHSCYIDVQLSHLNKDYLLTYLLVSDVTRRLTVSLNVYETAGGARVCIDVTAYLPVTSQSGGGRDIVYRRCTVIGRHSLYSATMNVDNFTPPRQTH